MQLFDLLIKLLPLSFLRRKLGLRLTNAGVDLGKGMPATYDLKSQKEENDGKNRHNPFTATDMNTVACRPIHAYLLGMRGLKLNNFAIFQLIPLAFYDFILFLVYQ